MTYIKRGVVRGVVRVYVMYDIYIKSLNKSMQ